MQQSKAIPFIVKDFTHDTYHLTPQAQALLSKINTPVSIVTVAGLYRTGKSYLLNRVILNRASGFGVGPTVNPCTKGLWIWGEPISVSGRTLLVVDTEGLGALDQQNNHDMKIFCLAVLLSSNFIYNSVGSIDETALQTLSLVLNLIAGIDKDSYSSRPNFLWVVRDFSLQLINEKGQQITPSQYLELALSTENQKQPQKLQLRKTITQAFTERECFTLIKPLIDQTKLQNLDKVSPDQLRPEFMSQTIALRKYIYQSLKQIKLNNSISLKGHDYMLMCKKFLDAINNGAVPDLLDTWGYIKQEKARQVTEQVRQNYTQKLRNRLNNKLPMLSIRLSQILNNLRQQAIDQFIQLSYDQASNEQLCEYLTASQSEMHKLNTKQSKSTLNQILRRQFQPFQRKLLSNYYSDATSYEHDLRTSFKNTIQEKFSERIDLPLLEIQLYTEKKITQGVKMFEKRSRDQLTRTRQSRSQIQGSLQNQIRNVNRIFDQERRKFQQQLFQLQKKAIVLANQKQRLQDNFQKQKREDQTQTTRIRRRADQNLQQLQSLEKELTRVQATNAEQERQIFFIKKELQKQKALSKQKEDHLDNKFSELQKRSVSMQQQLQSNLKSWQNQRRQLISQSQLKYDHILRQRKQLSDHLAETTNQLQHQKFMTNQLKVQIQTLRDRHQQELHKFRERFANSAKKDTKYEAEAQMYKELQEYKRKITILSQQVRDGDLKTRQLQQQLKLLKSQSEKQQAIASQKIQFQNNQNQQLRFKINQANLAYQKLLNSTQENNIHDIQQQFKRKVSQIQAQHARTIKQIQTQFQNKYSKARYETIQVIKQKDEVQLQINFNQKRWQEKQRYLLGTLQMHKKQFEDLKRKLNYTQQGHAESQRQKDHFYLNRIKQLQVQVDQVKRLAAQQSEQLTKKSQETVAFINQCREKEKSQFERRIQQQREKISKKERETIEQWSQRLNEQKQHYQNIIGQLQARLMSLNNQYSQQLQAMKCDTDIRIQKITNSALQERMDLTKKLALMQQEYQITKTNLTNQLEERSRQYSSAMQSQKKQLLYEFQQQIRAAKQAMEQLQGRLDSLKKANRKSEQSNLLLKSQLDKEKSMSKQKQQISSRRLKELQERFADQLRNNTKIIEELNEQHTLQNRRLNQEIEHIKHLLTNLQTQRTKLQSHHEQERASLIGKNNYLQTKIRRGKDQYEDLLRKFETTVKTLSNQKGQKQMQREMDDAIKRISDQYKHKLSQKQQSINQQRKDTQQKIMRLQTQNKSLRDKLLLFQMRQTHQSRYQFDPPQRQRPVLYDIKQKVQRDRNQIRRYQNK